MFLIMHFGYISCYGSCCCFYAISINVLSYTHWYGVLTYIFFKILVNLSSQLRVVE